MMRVRQRDVINVVAVLVIMAAVVILLNAGGKLSQNDLVFSGDITVSGEQRGAGNRLNHSYNISIVGPANASMKVKLIILTYMRSGSSFTGDLFNHHPEVFYVYEPLWSMQKHYNHGDPAFFFTKGPLYPVPHKFYDASSVSVDHLRSLLGCHFYQLDPGTLIHPFLRISLTTMAYSACQKKTTGMLGLLQCVPLLFGPCRKASVTAVKTIRFTMRQAAHLMYRDPKVKVVHLIRDPRATLRSQIHVGEFKRTDSNKTVKSFCGRVRDDLKVAELLNKQETRRVFIIRYEDLAMQPFVFAEKLLAFAGLKMDDQLRKYFWNITSAGLPDNCVICTTRNDSRKTAMAWRRKLDFRTSRQIDEECKDVYAKMGYLPLPTEQRKWNLSVPSLLEASKVPGIWT